MDAGKKKLSASLEGYLEAIYQIEEGKQAAKAKDIAERLQVKNSSVTGALQALARRKLINYAPYDVITCTENGRSLAREVEGRHKALCKFFQEVLDVDEEMAERAACRMKHSLPREISERLIGFIEYLAQMCDGEGRKLIEGFKSH